MSPISILPAMSGRLHYQFSFFFSSLYSGAHDKFAIYAIAHGKTTFVWRLIYYSPLPTNTLNHSHAHIRFVFLSVIFSLATYSDFVNTVCQLYKQLNIGGLIFVWNLICTVLFTMCIIFQALTEQIKYYNIKIQEVNEKMRQLALDSAQLSPSVFRKHYHPESAYSDYFAATSQHKRGVFPFHSPGQLFYDSLPVINFPSFSDEESSSPLARAFQDALENRKQSEHPKSVYGITPISLQLPRLIPPPRTDSIPRPTWSGEILAAAASLSDMTRGTSISHSVDSPRTIAKAFEAVASSPKFSTATAEASPENVQSVDAANTATVDSNTGKPSAGVLACGTYTYETEEVAEKLGLFAESAQTQASVGGGSTEILLNHSFVNENNQRTPNDCNTSPECDPKTDESSSTDWVLATSQSTGTQVTYLI